MHSETGLSSNQKWPEILSVAGRFHLIQVLEVWQMSLLQFLNKHLQLNHRLRYKKFVVSFWNSLNHLLDALNLQPFGFLAISFAVYAPLVQTLPRYRALTRSRHSYTSYCSKRGLSRKYLSILNMNMLRTGHLDLM